MIKKLLSVFGRSIDRIYVDTGNTHILEMQLAYRDSIAVVYDLNLVQEEP